MAKRKPTYHHGDLRRALLAHRSREPLAALGDLVLSGPTGTNVNDLLVVVLGADEADGG